MLKRTLSLLFTLILIVSIISPFTANANSKDHVGYSVQALIPENQLDSKHSYFDLLMKPNQKQALQATIYNDEQEEINVRVTVYNASTNSNGLVVYEEQEEIDSSLKVPLKEILILK